MRGLESISASGNKNNSVLIVGADGTIGRGLVAAFEATGETVWQTTRHRDRVGSQRIFLDLSRDVSHWPLPTSSISTAILCAAVTSLERCRVDPEFSRRVNVEGTIALAKRLVEARAFVIFLSTNLVFDGETPFAKPTDPVNPKTEYGRQKAEVELQLLAWGEQVAVVRLTKVLNPEIPLIRGWIESLRNGKVIQPFSDMVMAPLSLSFVVDVLKRVAATRLSRITQVSAREDVSYAQVARYLAQRLGVSIDLVQPISWRESDLSNEAMPAFTTIDTARLKLVLELEPSDVWTTIDRVFGLSK